MGVGQAASAIGGYQSQVAQTDARNRQIAASYNQNKRNYELGILQKNAGFVTKTLDVEIENDDTAMSASRAASKVQTAREAALAAIASKDRQLQEKKLVGTGRASEGGRSRSYGMNYERQIGRARGSLEAATEKTFVEAFAKRREIIEKANQARIKQWRQVSMGAAPDGPAPVMPTFLKGPSKLGLGIQLAGAALTAASPVLKVPGGGTTPPPNVPTTPTAPIPDLSYNVQLQSGFVPSLGAYS